MKSILAAAIVSLLILSSCEPERRLSLPKNEMIIEVECRDNRSVLQMVYFTLKLARVSGWGMREDGGVKYVQAYYEDLPSDKAHEIDARLHELYGVLNVDVRRGVLSRGTMSLEQEIGLR